MEGEPITFHLTFPPCHGAFRFFYLNKFSHDGYIGQCKQPESGNMINGRDERDYQKYQKLKRNFKDLRQEYMRLLESWEGSSKIIKQLSAEQKFLREKLDYFLSSKNMSDEALTEAIAAKYQELELEKEEKLKAAQNKLATAKAQNGSVNGNHQHSSREHSMNGGQSDKVQAPQSQSDQNAAASSLNQMQSAQIAKVQGSSEFQKVSTQMQSAPRQSQPHPQKLSKLQQQELQQQNYQGGSTYQGGNKIHIQQQQVNGQQYQGSQYPQPQTKRKKKEHLHHNQPLNGQALFGTQEYSRQQSVPANGQKFVHTSQAPQFQLQNGGVQQSNQGPSSSESAVDYRAYSSNQQRNYMYQSNAQGSQAQRVPQSNQPEVYQRSYQDEQYQQREQPYGSGVQQQTPHETSLYPSSVKGQRVFNSGISQQSYASESQFQQHFEPTHQMFSDSHHLQQQASLISKNQVASTQQRIFQTNGHYHAEMEAQKIQVSHQIQSDRSIPSLIETGINVAGQQLFQPSSFAPEFSPQYQQVHSEVGDLAIAASLARRDMPAESSAYVGYEKEQSTYNIGYENAGKRVQLE